MAQGKQEVISLDYEPNVKLYFNLKYDPLESDFLRQTFEGVILG
jgi:hypothetical protein